jgi:hypothetical protein
MANGDNAAAAGMDVVPGTAKVRLGYDEINKSRDYVANYAKRTGPLIDMYVQASAPAHAAGRMWVHPVS